MNKTLPLFVFVMFACSARSQNIQNGDFEDWTNGKPNLWSTMFLPGLITQVPGVTGHAVSIAPEFSEGAYQPPALLNIDESTFNYTTIPAGDYQSFTFDYKLHLEGGDIATYGIILYDQNMGLVSSNGGEFDASSESFTHFEVELLNFSNNPPVTAVVTFSISNDDTDPHAGSFFVLDNVDISETPASTGMKENGINVGMYPNPCNDLLTVTMPAVGSSIVMYNTCGAVVTSVANCQRTTEIIDVSSLPSGLYLMSIISGNKRTSRMVVVE